MSSLREKLKQIKIDMLKSSRERLRNQIDEAERNNDINERMRKTKELISVDKELRTLKIDAVNIV